MHVLQEVNIIKKNFNVMLVKMPVLEEEIPVNLQNDITRSRPREKNKPKESKSQKNEVYHQHFLVNRLLGVLIGALKLHNTYTKKL